MEISKVVDNIYRCSLPTGKNIAEYKKVYGIQTIVDLTQRERKIQSNACEKNNITYIKLPINYNCCKSENIVKEIFKAKKPLLYFCYHGRDRTGKVSRLIKRKHGRVILYNVNRNLNRSYRTCEAFGIPEIQLIKCENKIKGNLFKAKNKVKIIESEKIVTNNMIAFETTGKKEITQVNWDNIDTVFIGGETGGIPKNLNCEIYKIPQIGEISGLTVEAALAIILYEWGR